MSISTAPPAIVKRNQRDLWLLVLILVGLAIAGIWLFTGGIRVLTAFDPLVLWLAAIGLMVIFLFVIGYATNGQLLGALIDSTNHMSLSRLQITLWTVLTLTSYVLIVMPRLFGGLLTLDQLPTNDVKLLNCKLLLKKDVVTVAECGGGPLQITFPEELVIAMGISAVSFAGSSLIQSNKKRKDVNIQSRDASVNDARKKRDDALAAVTKADDETRAMLSNKIKLDKDLQDAQAKLTAATTDDEKKAAQGAINVMQVKSDYATRVYQDAAAKFETAKADLNTADAALKKVQDDYQAAQSQAEGLLHKNSDPSQANVLDLFRGSEVGNYRLIDMGKVQMFFFTIVIVAAYAVAVLTLLHDSVAIANPLGVDFPPFSNSLNTLLGISHAAYLSNNTIDHTPTST